MQKYESVFEYLHVAFVTALTIYRNSLEELLGPLELSDTQLYKLLEEGDNVAWNNAEISANLRERLGSSYLPFRSSLKQLHKKVKLFARKLQLSDKMEVKFFSPPLGLSKHPQPPWIGANGHVNIQDRESFFKNPLNRVRGGFNFEKHKQLLSSLQEDINRIASLSSTAIALEPLRLNRKRISNAAHWTRCQKYAERLYNSLNTRWSSQCACQCLHQANLRLPLPNDVVDHVAPFKVLFSFDKGSTAPGIPSEWRSVNIESAEDIHYQYVQIRTQSSNKSEDRVDCIIPSVADFSSNLGLHRMYRELQRS
jgi:hypothetical protein